MAYRFSEFLKSCYDLYQVNDLDPDCTNCRFALFDARQVDQLTFVAEFGVCRKRAPAMLPDSNAAVFPQVHVDDWCDDHEYPVNEVNDAKP